MATKTRTRSGGSTGTARSANGLVSRAIRSDKKIGVDIEHLLQVLGEFYFGVERIEDLDTPDRHGWIKFSTTVGNAHHNLGKLAQVLEKAIESEHAADLRLIAAEIELLEKRHDDEAARARRDQTRREAKEDATEARKNAAFQEHLADRSQKRELERASHGQDLRERETRRKTQRARDVALIGVTVFCVLLAAFLLIVGAIEGKAIFFGGSGVSAVIGVAGIAKMLFGWREEQSPEPQGERGSLAGAS